jgi:hypothetical protein
MMGKLKFLFGLSGILGFLASINSPVLFPYPLLVLAVWRGWRLPRIGAPGVQLLVATAISTSILEISAWLDNFIKNEPEPALFHPQLIPDLIISVGVYSAWWLAWWLILHRYRFTALQVFITTGLYGILIEQQGKIFLAGLAAFPLGIALWLFVAVAYGSTMALAFCLAGARFTALNESKVKYPAAWLLLLALTLATSLLWGVVLQVTGIIPPAKMPMQDFPFW